MIIIQEKLREIVRQHVFDFDSNSMSWKEMDDKAVKAIMALVVSTIPGEETGVTDDDESEACKYGWNSCRDRMLETWTEGKK